MRTRRRCSLLILVTALFVSVTAYAQTADAVSPEVQALSDRARVESGKGNLKEAARLYKEAYEIQQSPVLLFNIARTLHKLTRFDEAIVYYQLFVDSPVADEGQKRKAREALELLRGASGLRPETSPQKPPAPHDTTGPSLIGTDSTGPSIGQPATTTASTAQSFRPSQTPGTSQQGHESISTPIYRRWWLWTIVGGVVVVGGAIGLGLGLSNTLSSKSPFLEIKWK